MLMFSIILPTFNRAHMIHPAIESVLNQIYKDWELIVVDDGSTDKTKEIIDKYIEKDKRVRYLYQKNKERSAARNYGIKGAKGDWICFLDSDDMYHKNHLEEFKSLIEKNNNKKGLYFSGVSYGEYSEDLEEYNMSYNNNLEFVLLNTIGTPRACASKQILKKHQFNQEINIGEDKELWSRISQFYPVIFHKKKTFIELEHPNRSINLGSEQESLRTLKFILKTVKIKRPVKKKILSNSFFNISKMHIRNEQKVMAFLYILRSILMNIKNKQNKHRTLLLLSIIGFYKPIYRQYKTKIK